MAMKIKKFIGASYSALAKFPVSREFAAETGWQQTASSAS
jgi:hypothetical protein